MPRRLTAMDPLSASLLTGTLTTLLGSAAGEAGKQAWQALTSGVRQLLAKDSPAVQQLEHADPQPDQLAASITDAAGDNPEFGEWLNRWHAETITIVSGQDAVANTVSGHATNVVQARDIHGPVTFGN